MQDPALSAPLCWEPALGQHCVRQLKFLLCTFAVAGLDKNTSLKCEGCQVWIVALFFFVLFVFFGARFKAGFLYVKLVKML